MLVEYSTHTIENADSLTIALEKFKGTFINAIG